MILSFLECFNIEKVYRSARICLQILAAKCLQAGESPPLSKHFKRKMLQSIANLKWSAFCKAV
jgi:hypothetical protein